MGGKKGKHSLNTHDPNTGGSVSPVTSGSVDIDQEKEVGKVLMNGKVSVDEHSGAESCCTWLPHDIRYMLSAHRRLK